MTEAGERLNERGFAELRERIAEVPVLRSTCWRSNLAAAPSVTTSTPGRWPRCSNAPGRRIVTSGLGSQALIGGEGWDAAALVEYPTRGAFLE